MLQVFDRDRDGYISMDEVQATIRSVGGNAVEHVDLEQMAKVADTNKDWKVDYKGEKEEKKVGKVREKNTEESAAICSINFISFFVSEFKLMMAGHEELISEVLTVQEEKERTLYRLLYGKNITEKGMLLNFHHQQLLY